METKISAKRLKELERMEAKLSALEAGGVDNWDGYDFALEDYHKENEIDKMIEDFIDGIQETMADGVDVEHPAELEAGYCVTLNDKGEADITRMVRGILDKAEELKKK